VTSPMPSTRVVAAMPTVVVAGDPTPAGPARKDAAVALQPMNKTLTGKPEPALAKTELSPMQPTKTLALSAPGQTLALTPPPAAAAEPTPSGTLVLAASSPAPPSFKPMSPVSPVSVRPILASGTAAPVASRPPPEVVKTMPATPSANAAAAPTPAPPVA